MYFVGALRRSMINISLGSYTCIKNEITLHNLPKFILYPKLG